MDTLKDVPLISMKIPDISESPMEILFKVVKAVIRSFFFVFA